MFDYQLGTKVLGINLEYTRVTQYLGGKNVALVSVTVGHGVQGAGVASFVGERLPARVKECLENEMALEGASKKDASRRALVAAIDQVSLAVEGGALDNQNITNDKNGCVLACVLLEDDQLTAANVGNARVVVAKRSKDGLSRYSGLLYSLPVAHQLCSDCCQHSRGSSSCPSY